MRLICPRLLGFCFLGVLVLFVPGCPPVNEDRDSDGVIDAVDNCPDDVNADQADSDNDGTGDACDAVDDDRVMPAGELAELCFGAKVICQEKLDGTNVGVFFSFAVGSLG